MPGNLRALPTQLLDPELSKASVRHKPPVSLIISNKPAQIDDLRPTMPARGIVIGVLISIPFWVVFTLVVWKFL